MPAIVAYLLIATVTAGTGIAASESAERRGLLELGDRGPAVQQLNDALARSGFHPDRGDLFGRKTRHAVFAFQKHYDLPTSGRFSLLMWDLLDQSIELPERPEPDRVEVDLGKQVLYVVADGTVVLILPISSGSGEAYIGSNGKRQLATTPEGVFRFQRRVVGVRRAPLGMLYHPFYFRGGIAVHGSPSVPNYPASHGCVRVTMWDMELLVDHLEVGQTIYVYADSSQVGEVPRDRRAGAFV